HGTDVVGLDRAPVLVPQQVLDQHLEGEGQLGDAGQPVLLGVRQREVLVGLAADLEGLLAFESVGRCGGGAHDLDLLAIRLPTRSRAILMPCKPSAGGGCARITLARSGPRSYKTVLISWPGRGKPFDEA